MPTEQCADGIPFRFRQDGQEMKLWVEWCPGAKEWLMLRRSHPKKDWADSYVMAPKRVMVAAAREILRLAGENDAD